MYIIQNALKNVARNRGRNILLGIIIFAIIVTSVVSLMINNASNRIIDDYKFQFSTEVFITPDTSRISPGSGGGIPKLLPQQAYDLSQSEYIREAILSVAQEVAGVNMHAIGESAGEGGIIANVGDGGDEYVNPQFRLLGNSWEEFNRETRSIAEGKMVENDYECIVSTDFARLNGLSVGDTLTLVNSVFINSNRDVRTVTRELTLVGIYNDYTDEYVDGYFTGSLSNKPNEVLTTFATVLELIQPGEYGYSLNSRFFLKDPSVLKDFEAFARASGIDKNLRVYTDEEAYNKVVGPVEGMRNITFTFMIIVLILGATIIMLLASIAIRERKYEIGVLRAMGMKKGKVAFGLWAEMIAITCICLCAGLLIGTLVSQPITNVLLSQQIEIAKEAATAPRLMIGGVQTSSAEYYTTLDKLDVSLGISTLLEIIGISLTLASIAGLAAISKITKYEPIKILMERN